MAASEGFLGWLKGLDEGYRNGLADNVTRLTNQVPIVATRGAVIDQSVVGTLNRRLHNEAADEGLDAARLAALHASLKEQGVDLPFMDSVEEFRSMAPGMGSSDEMIHEVGRRITEGDDRPSAAQRRAIYDIAQNGPGGPEVVRGPGEFARTALSGAAGHPLAAYGIPVAAAVGGYLLLGDEGDRNYVAVSNGLS